MKIRKIVCFLGLSLTFSFNAFATQIVKVYPDIEKRITVSGKAINRIHFENDSVVSVYANQGELVYSRSEAKGDLYIRVNDNYGKIVNLFVETKRGYSYKLLLAPLNVPSEQIILVNPAIVSKQPLNKKDGYKQRIASLVSKIRQNQIPEGYEINQEYKESKYWIKGLKIKQVAQIHSPLSDERSDFLVDKYYITNQSEESIKLDQEQFLKLGVVAVTVEKELIAPKEKIELLIVRGG